MIYKGLAKENMELVRTLKPAPLDEKNISTDWLEESMADNGQCASYTRAGITHLLMFIEEYPYMVVYIHRGNWIQFHPIGHVPINVVHVRLQQIMQDNNEDGIFVFETKKAGNGVMLTFFFEQTE